MTARDQAGPELATFRAVPPLGFLAIFLVAALALVGLVYLVRPDPVMALVVAAVPLLAGLAFLVGGWLDKIRVCRDGLLLGFGGSVFVPYEGIDPGRVYLARGVFLARHVAAAVTATRTTTGTALVVNGPARATPLNLAAAPVSGPSPFGWYLLRATAPRQMLEALESAMVAHGAPARGLTAATLDLRQVRATYSTDGPPLVLDRGPGDPPLGVAAPAPRR